MTSVITIHGKPFSIGFSEADETRRASYFKKSSGNLTPQEKSLLLSLGVDTILENSLKPYLTKFFSSLQTCTSDSSLVLSRDCETAYFVIWSALFHNRAEVERRLRAENGAGVIIDDYELATDGALVGDLTGRSTVDDHAIPITVDDDVIRSIFTPIFIDIPAVKGDEDTIRFLFTPIFVADDTDDGSSTDASTGS